VFCFLQCLMKMLGIEWPYFLTKKSEWWQNKFLLWELEFVKAKGSTIWNLRSDKNYSFHYHIKLSCYEYFPVHFGKFPAETQLTGVGNYCITEITPNLAQFIVVIVDIIPQSQIA
jgi:hypothetical protein